MKKIPYVLIIIINLVIVYKVVDIKFINNNKYNEEYLIKSNNIIQGKTPLRGKILDRNNNVLADNIPIYNINYRKIKSVNTDEEISIAKHITKILDLNELADDKQLIDFYILKNDISSFLTYLEKRVQDGKD